MYITVGIVSGNVKSITVDGTFDLALKQLRSLESNYMEQFRGSEHTIDQIATFCYIENEDRFEKVWESDMGKLDD